jgi:hypothetical protein
MRLNVILLSLGILSILALLGLISLSMASVPTLNDSSLMNDKEKESIAKVNESLGDKSTLVDTKRHFNVTFKSLRNWDNVSNSTIIEGTIEPTLRQGEEYLWIATSPVNSPYDWWPQTGGPIKVFDGAFASPAYLGGKKGDLAQIAILVVDNGLNTKISQWLENCRSTNYWPAITRKDPSSNVTVSNDVINDHIVGGVIVRLN